MQAIHWRNSTHVYSIVYRQSLNTNLVVPRTGELTRLVVTSEEGSLGGIAVTIILEKFIDLVTAAIVSLASLLLFTQLGTFQSAKARNIALFASILCIGIILFFISVLFSLLCVI